MGLQKYLGIITGLLFLFMAHHSIAQKTAKTKEPVYLMPDVKPKFLNGDQDIQAYFAKRTDTKNGGKREIVTVSLVVTKTGAVNQVYIGKGISPAKDSAVAKIARTMVGWKPGKIKGETVNARVLFPIVFGPPFAETVKTKAENLDPENETPDLSGLEEVEERRQVYVAVEQKPGFPGGEEALQAFLKKNLVYPDIDKKNGTKGVVVIQFVVETSGYLTELRVLKHLSETTTKEAMRVIKLMPHWQPGKQNGRPVAVQTSLIVRFPPAE